jgi:hypothetical protein
LHASQVRLNQGDAFNQITANLKAIRPQNGLL